MRKELGIIGVVVDICIGIIWFLLDKQFEKIPMIIVIIGYIVVGLTLALIVLYRFIPIRKIWGFIMSIRIRLPFFLSKQGDSKITNKAPSWIQQVLISDKSELGKRIFISRQHWFFNDIGSTEPFIEVILHIINASIFPIVIEGVEGSFQIQGTKCNWDANDLPPENSNTLT